MLASSNQTLSMLNHHNTKDIACFDNINEIELKVQHAISTLTDVLKDLQKRKTNLSDVLNPFNLYQAINTSQVAEHNEFLTQHNLASVIFPNGTNTGGVAVVKLIAQEDKFSANKCDVCGKVFDDRQKLRNHSRIHRQIRKYKCEICSLGFPVPSKLKEHMRTHTGERPYECELCLRCFTKSSSLKRHRRVHNNFVQPSPFRTGGYSVLHDQVVQSVDQVLSPAYKAEEMEPETSCVTFDTAFLAHAEPELSCESVSPK